MTGDGDGKRLREIVEEVLLAEVVGVARRDAAAPPADVVVADEDVDWSDPREPTVVCGLVFPFGDGDIWARLARHRPAWVNVACYPLADGRLGIVIARARHAAEYRADPAISLSSAPAGTALTIGYENDDVNGEHDG